MAEDPEIKLRDEASDSLKRIQIFNAESLAREEDLGQRFHFLDAVTPAKRLISLYQRLAPSTLEDLPQTQLKQVQDRANQDFNRFDEILRFDPTQQNAVAVREQMITNIKKAYQDAFQTLHPLISYSLYKTADFQRLDGEARVTLQTIRDNAEAINGELQKNKEEAQRVLGEIRKVAGEQGVTQQAIHFSNSAEYHDGQAKKWQSYTMWVAAGLTVYALASFFFHKIPGLEPANTYQAVQISVSKVLVFAVISYILYLCARSFTSHKHNAIIDRHRQHALMTYRALVEAAGETPNKEVILVQAAHCIFSPQCTGYTSETVSQPPGAKSVVEFLSRPLKGGN